MFFRSPASPDPARRSKSMFFKRILIQNRWFFDPRPLPTRFGAQNQYFFKGFSIEIEGFSVPGRFRPDPALKIDTFSKDSNCTALQPWRSWGFKVTRTCTIEEAAPFFFGSRPDPGAFTYYLTAWGKPAPLLHPGRARATTHWKPHTQQQ